MLDFMAVVFKTISKKTLVVFSSVFGITWLYFFLACYDLKVPGANYDEMLYQAPAVNFLIDSVKTEPMQINPSVISIGGRPFPLMLMTYIGSVKVLWHIIVFLLFGISVETARLGSVVLGMIALIFIFVFVRRLFSEWTAFVTIILIATSAEYVFYTSRDMTIVFMILAKMAALFFFVIYRDTSKPIFFLAGSVAVGLGLYDKASFLWFIITLIIFILIYYRSFIRSIPLKHYIIAGSGFFLSGIVFFIFNLIRLGETFAPLVTDFHKTSGGVDNADFFSNLWIRAEQFYSLLDGNGLSLLFTQSAVDNVITSYLPVILTVLMVVPLVLVFFRVFAEYRRKIIFAVFFFLIPLAMTTFTPSSLSLHHVAIAWPFHLILAASAFGMIYHFFRINIVKFVSGIVFISVIVMNVVSVFELYGKIHDEGSAGNWSETIYELNDDLSELNQPTVLMTWGFTNNLIVTSGGKLSLIRHYRDVMKTEHEVGLKILRSQIHHYRYFLFSVNQPGSSESEQNLQKESLKLGFHAELEKSFYQKNGEIIYKLYSVKPIQQNSAE